MNILILSPFRVYPPLYGGHLATFNVNKALSERNRVFLFSTGVRRNELFSLPRSKDIRINDNFFIYNYFSLLCILLNLDSRIGTNNPPLRAGTALSILKPRILLKEMEKADIIQVEFPWLFKWACENNKKRAPLVLVEHNVESVNFSRLYGEDNRNRRLFNRIMDMETYAVKQADGIVVFTCEDKRELIESFGVDEGRVRVIPCAVDTEKFKASSIEEKLSAKRMLGFEGKVVILFSGALYEPNIEAVNFINRIADEFKDREDVLFLIAGRVGEFFEKVDKRNVVYTGFVDDILPYFKCADIAINPVVSGSGMNVKILEYLASGLPVVTTEFGIRGFDENVRDGFIISSHEDFSRNIRMLIDHRGRMRELSEKGRKLVERHYSPGRIALERERFYKYLLKCKEVD